MEIMKRYMAMIIPFFILLFPWGCSSPTTGEVSGKEVSRVEVLKIRPETLRETILTAGVARGMKEYRISTQVGGMLRVHYKDRGDMVAKGEVLFEIDSEEFQLLVRERAANLERARARLKFMEQEKERKEHLYRAGNLSEDQWDQLLMNLNLARAERDQALVGLEQAERNLRLTVIRSPADGMILERFHEDGEVVPPGTVLARIVDIKRIIFEVGLSDLDLKYIRTGMPATVTVDAIPGRTFKGEITLISGNANPSSGTFPVEITINNPKKEVLPGFVGRIELPGPVHEGKIIIPLGSINTEFEIPYVYVVEQDRAVKRIVKLGRVMGERVVIEKGLHMDDYLIIVGQSKLKPGEPVEIVSIHS